MEKLEVGIKEIFTSDTLLNYYLQYIFLNLHSRHIYFQHQFCSFFKQIQIEHKSRQKLPSFTLNKACSIAGTYQFINTLQASVQLIRWTLQICCNFCREKLLADAWLYWVLLVLRWLRSVEGVREGILGPGTCSGGQDHHSEDRSSHKTDQSEEKTTKVVEISPPTRNRHKIHRELPQFGKKQFQLYSPQPLVQSAQLSGEYPSSLIPSSLSVS